ncbi:cupin domain-containing protein [Marinomonas balearica]|uniref:cupin domain-containing protein n=1 Tax=Marinomonas balearica TaxID=491947 RepID=UPI0026910712
MNGISTRLHWTNEPYKWHINDGEEVFVVLDGKVEMQYKEGNEKYKVYLNLGDLFFASIGTEHIATPIGEARILVVEKAGSI